MNAKPSSCASHGAANDYFRALYDRKADYVARREPGSFAAQQILHEVLRFKIPGLMVVLPDGFFYGRVVEIGCATGELIANFPAPHAGAIRCGYDLSPLNIDAARSRFTHVEFRVGDFRAVNEACDLAILSDVLEHVPDDVDLLSAAAERATMVLVNLPLEVNLLNCNRDYGVTDASGHLRAYSLESGFQLAARAKLEILRWTRIWAHETPYDIERRSLRRECSGHEFSGGMGIRQAKAVVHWLARRVPAFGRKLYPSNLFFSARRKQ